MVKLTNLKPTLGGIDAAHTPLGYSEHDRSQDKAWRSWYWSKEWRGTRKAEYTDGVRFKILRRDHFTCQMCGKIGTNLAELVVDHCKPHRGNPALFWDEDNLQTLCKSPCHDKHKQKQEQGDIVGVWY